MLTRWIILLTLSLTFPSLNAKETKLNGIALAKLAEQHTTKHGDLKYIFGSADPKKGGFDCSGAIYYILRQAGLKPPRTSAQQYTWVKNSGNLHSTKGITTLNNPAFKHLQPGDLLFWSGTYTPTDGRKVNITHVGIYLGKIKGKQVMASSSSGRSRNGKRLNGYKITDFKLPSPKSKSKFEGYGRPPGILPNHPKDTQLPQFKNNVLIPDSLGNAVGVMAGDKAALKRWQVHQLAGQANEY